jgi:tetratricopeptide (TPR) repeat protein
VRSPDENCIFQQGLDLKREKKFQEAITCFLEVYKAAKEKMNPDLLFNLGECYWHCGDYGRAAEFLETVMKINKVDPDAQNILRKIRARFPRQVVDFRKDGCIIDANFIINFCNMDFRHFPRFLQKARKKFNLYTSLNVYAEILQPDLESFPCSFENIQQLFEESMIIFPVSTESIDILESRLLSEFEDAPEIKARHLDRAHAWKNDLSLLCLLTQIQNPIRYIVTNDGGIQQIIHFLHPDKDPHYYLRPNDLFLASVDQVCQTSTRALWEQQIYGRANF